MTESKMGWIGGWKEIAKYCGEVTEQTVQKYAAQKGLPVRKIGKKVFAMPSELDKWLIQQDSK